MKIKEKTNFSFVFDGLCQVLSFVAMFWKRLITDGRRGESLWEMWISSDPLQGEHEV